jgi:hypothetical protein
MKRTHEHGDRHLMGEVDRLNGAPSRETVRERLPFSRRSDDHFEPFSNRRVDTFGDRPHQGGWCDLEDERENQQRHRGPVSGFSG